MASGWIAAALASAGVDALGLYDSNAESAIGLGRRLQAHYAQVKVTVGSNDPAGYAIVVNATPL
jgi:shikimate dehydrogenase